MPWNKLRDGEVWVKVDARGEVVTDRDGRIELAYKPTTGTTGYRGLLAPEPATKAEAGKAAAKPTAEGAAAAPAASSEATGVVQVWTDGACSGNPGPAGIGVVVIDGADTKEISEYLGEATNNIAELTAIQRGLEQVRDRTRPVVVYTDSEYSIGVLTKPWKAKKNVELIEDLRALCKSFKKLEFVKVAGHSGIALNDRVDELAREAVTRRR